MITPPAVHEIGHLTLKPYDTLTLRNGLKVHTVLDDLTDICRLTLMLPGGAAESELPELFVVANSLLAEGTRSHTAQELTDSLDFEGAWWGPGIDNHYSPLNFYSLSSKMPAILKTALEMLTEPVFPQTAIDNSLMMMGSRIRVNRRKASYLSMCEMQRMIFEPHSPLSREPQLDLLPQYTRERIAEAHFSRLVPSEIHCTIAGNLSDADFASILGMLETLGASREEFAFAGNDLRNNYTPQRVDLPHEATGDQMSVRISVPTVGRRHPDFIPVRFAVMALGGIFGSRLMSNIREEKGLTYGINAVLRGYPEGGIMAISCQTSDPEQVITECEREIVRLTDPASYTPEEIIRLRSSIISTLASVLDTPLTRMDFLQTQLTAQTPPDYFEAQQREARRLNGEMLARAAEYLQGPRLIVTA